LRSECDLDANRAIPPAAMTLLREFPKDAAPMDALRSGDIDPGNV